MKIKEAIMKMKILREQCSQIEGLESYITAIDKLIEVVETNIKKKDYLIEGRGNLALCYKTFLSRETNDDDIEICAYNEDKKQHKKRLFRSNRWRWDIY